MFVVVLGLAGVCPSSRAADGAALALPMWKAVRECVQWGCKSEGDSDRYYRQKEGGN